jgi:hypothetical protein
VVARPGCAGRPARGRGRELRKLFAVLVVLLALLLVGDVAARAYAETQTQQEVNKHTGENLDLRVSISSFPFVPRVLFSGEVQRITAHAPQVHEGPLDVSALRLQLNDVRVDRNKTLRKQRVILKSVGRGSLSAELTAEGLSDAFGVSVHVVDGAVEVEIAGRTMRSEMSFTNGVLRLGVAGVSLPVLALPVTGLLPCHPNATLADDRIKLACSFNKVPARLIALVNGGS